MKYTTALEKVGLNNKESLIYESLLKNGPSSIVAISHLSGINRPALYTLLPKMIQRNLILEIKQGKRTQYQAMSPNNLDPIIKLTQNSLESIVNNLNNEYSKKKIIPQTEIYYGKSGIARVFMDVVTTLDKGETYYRYSVRHHIVNDFLPPAYRKVRDAKKLERLVITNEASSKLKKPKLERFVKVLPGNYEVFNVGKVIYKNKIAYVDYENEVACIIFNESIYKLEKKIFMSLYKSL